MGGASPKSGDSEPRGEKPIAGADASGAWGDQSAAPRRELANRQLGDFLLLRRLGSGGMGEVYLAQQMALKRQVALKVLRQDMMSDDTARRRFAVEAEAAAKLTHNNIVQIYASGTQDGIHYMALEYVQGLNLRDYVAKKGPVTAAFALRVMEQVAAALQHAAEAGVVHRDIKPDNILLTRKGQVKVGDFGLARLRLEKPVHLTQPGVTMGTPLYMSPEQVEAKPLDSRSDLYSFGATCYYMLVGQPPYRGDTALAIAVQHIRKDPEPLATMRPDLPAELCRVVHKLMAKNPDERYQTGRQLLRDVQKLRNELDTEENEPAIAAAVATAEKSSAAMPVPRDPAFDASAIWIRLRRPAWQWFAASVVLALASGAAYGWFCRAPDLRPRADRQPSPTATARWEDVPKKENAEAQYRFATWAGQDIDAEAAWLAVIHYWTAEADWVLVAQMELGKHYLMEHMLDKADGLFGEMTQAFDDRTRLAGEVGKAMTLSFRDRPGESQIALWEHVRETSLGLDRRPGGGPTALADRTLLSMILWTFERNYRDLGLDWDDDVKKWANRRIQRIRPLANPRPGDPGGGPVRSPNG
jgi:tRNA A-37 threonylcarbamoyl transferase component Bud32